MTDGNELADDASYLPINLIRCHQPLNDPCNINTEVWGVAFEPDPHHRGRHTSFVATCGGNMVCVIEIAESVEVKTKFSHRDKREQFHCLAWTTMTLDYGIKVNVLATGTALGKVRLFIPKRNLCYRHVLVGKKKGDRVNAITFHSEKPSWLFIATESGLVSLWDIGKPQRRALATEMLRVPCDRGPVNYLAWTGDNSWLLASTEQGLVGWHLDDVSKKVKQDKLSMVEFLLPLPSEKDKNELDEMVDGLDIISKWIIVCKRPDAGMIYVWDLRATLRDKREEVKQTKAQAAVLAVLKWDNTCSYFMNLNFCNGLLACGGKDGSLCLFKVPSFKGLFKSDALQTIIEPEEMLKWPDVKDTELKKSRKILRAKDVIINNVAISYDHNFIVAVTNKNFVAIWRKAKENDVDLSDF